MLAKRVSDLNFGKLRVRYGKNRSYEWDVEGLKLKFATTRHLMSQRKLRDKLIEEAGFAVLPVSSAAWTMILNKALSEIDLMTTEELENLWLRSVAEYIVKNKTDDASQISKGRVYVTTTGFLFTSRGLAAYMRKNEKTSVFSGDWHTEKLRSLLNAKSVSTTLKGFRGRAIKLNNFSCRVDQRFYKYYSEAA